MLNSKPVRMIFALGAMLLLAGLLAGCGGGSGSDDSGGPSAPEALVNSDAAVDQDGGSDGTSASLTDRKVTRTATLELSVEDVATSVQSIDDIATAAGGFVSGSSVFVDERGDGESVANRRTQAGTVTIRVPADAYSAVMKQLRGIATEVVSETSDDSEVTEEYTDLQARLRNLEATEQSYLKLLAQAAAIPDILTVQDRLNSVRLEIEQAQGRINVLDDLTALATVTVRLNQPPLVAGEDKGWAEEAWDASLSVAEGAVIVAATVAIFAGVSMLWLVPVFLLIAIAWRIFGRRIVENFHRLLGVN